MRVSKYFNITNETFKLCKHKSVSNSHWQWAYNFLFNMLYHDYEHLTQKQKIQLIKIKWNLEPDDEFPFKKTLKKVPIQEVLQAIKERKEIQKDYPSEEFEKEDEDDKKVSINQKTVSRVMDNFLKQDKNVKWKPEVDPEAMVTPIESFEPRFKKFPESGRNIRRDEMLKTNTEFDIISYRNTQEILDKIGEWGEKKVFVSLREYLQRKYKGHEFESNEYNFKVLQGKNILAELDRLNRSERVQEGYDLTLTENGNTKFIEVKSTISDEFDIIELSGKQWEFIKAKGDNYIIYRVFKAGYKDSWIEEIKNPFKNFVDGKLEADRIRLKL